MNAVGVAMRMTAEVREKWKSLHSQAKKEFTELAKEQKKLVVGQLQRRRRLHRLIERYTYFYQSQGVLVER